MFQQDDCCRSKQDHHTNEIKQIAPSTIFQCFTVHLAIAVALEATTNAKWWQLNWSAFGLAIYIAKWSIAARLPIYLPRHPSPPKIKRVMKCLDELLVGGPIKRDAQEFIKMRRGRICADRSNNDLSTHALANYRTPNIYLEVIILSVCCNYHRGVETCGNY